MESLLFITPPREVRQVLGDIQRISSPCDLKIDNVSVKEVGQNWDLGSGWSIGDGVATHTGAQSLLAQYNAITIGKSYKISFDLTNADNSNYVRLISSQYPNGSDYKTNGTHVVYTSTNIAHFWIYGIEDVTITNISVKEVGQDWTLGTGWSVDQANSKAKSITNGCSIIIYNKP